MGYKGRNDEIKTTLYTDGSCLGNPGPGGAAFALVARSSKGEEVKVLTGSKQLENTTNNRAELEALILGLSKINRVGAYLLVRTDSKYITETMNGFWQRNQNLDLWYQIDQIISEKGLTVKFDWARRNQSKYNKLCDSMARAAAKSQQKSIELPNPEHPF